MGSRTVVKVTTEFSKSCYQRIAAEYKKLGLKTPESQSQRNRVEAQTQTLSECDQILAISSFVKDSLVDNGFASNQIFVTPLGVNVEDYPTNHEADDDVYTVLYVGTVSIAKGIHHLLEAWLKNGWANEDSVQLQLCGNVSPVMREIISEYNFENVEMPGFVDPRDYHKEASVFVFPSISDGFGRAPIEAMAAGIPVVTTENTGVADIITQGEDGYIIPAADASSLADALSSLRESPTRRQQMGQQAIETARSQTWDKHVESVIDALELTPCQL
jgi:glycosyltransferase involved in cell wall biosynthesis